MTTTPMMQHRARLKRKKARAQARIRGIAEAIISKKPLEWICKTFNVRPTTLERIKITPMGTGKGLKK